MAGLGEEAWVVQHLPAAWAADLRQEALEERPQACPEAWAVGLQARAVATQVLREGFAAQRCIPPCQQAPQTERPPSACHHANYSLRFQASRADGP